MSVEVNITQSDNWFIDEDKVIEFTVLQSDDLTPEDITTWALEYVLCDSAEVAQFTKTVGSGITITDGPNGVLEVAVADSDTASLTAGKFSHRLRRTDLGLEAVLAHGAVLLQSICS